MNQQTVFCEITNPVEKSLICAAITETIPDWFGIDEANAMYRSEIVDKDVFASFDGETAIGALAIHYHFDTTAEIWWMGVRASSHRQGIGSKLMDMAFERARVKLCKYLVLNTLSPKSRDLGYSATRDFYLSRGFRPLVNFNQSEQLNPMMWMIRSL